MDPLANLPDFVDPDEAIVSSWSEADGADWLSIGNFKQPDLGVPRFKDYTSQDATEGGEFFSTEITESPHCLVFFLLKVV